MINTKQKHLGILVVIAVIAIGLALFVLQDNKKSHSEILEIGGESLREGVSEAANQNDPSFSTTTDESVRVIEEPPIVQEKRTLPAITLTALTNDEIREIMASGVAWMKNAQEENGHLQYEYLPVADVYSNDDNMVRQMGALYELGEIFLRDDEDAYDLADTLQKSIEYALSRTFEVTFSGVDSRCIASSGFQCSMGATSLGLIGIIDLVEGRPDLETQYEDLIDDYASFIISMRNPGAGVRAKYNLYKDDEEQSDRETPFFNGEAFLALVRYNIHSPDAAVKKHVDELFKYSVELYGDTPDPNYYLWGMAAVKYLYGEDPRQEYIDFVKPYTDWRVSAYSNLRDSQHNRCAYIEGVASAYSVLEPSVTHEEAGRLLEEINFWLAKSAELQMGDGDTLTIFSGDKSSVFPVPRPEQAVGGFLTGLDIPLQRIDFTQHCLSGYLQKLVDIDGYDL